MTIEYQSVRPTKYAKRRVTVLGWLGLIAGAVMLLFSLVSTYMLLTFGELEFRRLVSSARQIYWAIVFGGLGALSVFASSGLLQGRCFGLAGARAIGMAVALASALSLVNLLVLIGVGGLFNGFAWGLLLSYGGFYVLVGGGGAWLWWFLSEPKLSAAFAYSEPTGAGIWSPAPLVVGVMALLFLPADLLTSRSFMFGGGLLTRMLIASAAFCQLVVAAMSVLNRVLVWRWAWVALAAHAAAIVSLNTGSGWFLSIAWLRGTLDALAVDVGLAVLLVWFRQTLQPTESPHRAVTSLDGESTHSQRPSLAPGASAQPPPIPAPPQHDPP